MRIIFDTIERALFGTHFSEGICSLFRYESIDIVEKRKDIKIAYNVDNQISTHSSSMIFKCSSKATAVSKIP